MLNHEQDIARGPMEISCFGKLPSYGDFVRLNTNGGDLQALDQWLSEGIHYAAEQLGPAWNETYLGSLPYYYIFTPAGESRRFLAGALCPSQDSTQRTYPFIVSIQYGMEKIPGERIRSIPVMLADILDVLAGLVRDASAGILLPALTEKARAVGERLGERFDSGEDRYRDFLARTTLGDFFGRIFGSFDDERKYFVLENLVGILEPLVLRDVAYPALGLRFPVAAGMPAAYQAGFWLDLIERLLGHPLRKTPVMFWPEPRENDPAYLFFFFTTPKATNFLQLLRPEMESDYLCFLDAKGVASGRASGPAAALAGEDRTLGQFLRLLDQIPRPPAGT